MVWMMRRDLKTVMELVSLSRRARERQTSARDPSCEKVDARMGSMYFGYSQVRLVGDSVRDGADQACSGAVVRLTFGAPGLALVASLMSLL
jgi:hypothetical protein